MATKHPPSYIYRMQKASDAVDAIGVWLEEFGDHLKPQKREELRQYVNYLQSFYAPVIPIYEILYKHYDPITSSLGFDRLSDQQKEILRLPQHEARASITKLVEAIQSLDEIIAPHSSLRAELIGAKLNLNGFLDLVNNYAQQLAKPPANAPARRR